MEHRYVELNRAIALERAERAEPDLTGGAAP